MVGDPTAKADLVNRAEARLLILTRKLLRGLGPGQDETAAIVSEAHLKLHTALDAVRPTTVRHFVGLASLQMRRVLINLVRATMRAGRKLNGGDTDVVFDVPGAAKGNKQ